MERQGKKLQKKGSLIRTPQISLQMQQQYKFYNDYKMVKSLYMKSKSNNSQKYRTFHTIWAKNASFNSHQLMNKPLIRRDSSPGGDKSKKNSRRLGINKEKISEKEILRQEISRVPNQISMGPLTNHLFQNQLMQKETKSQEYIAKGLKKFNKKEYFNALKNFSKAANIFEIDAITPNLKRSNEWLFEHLIDCYLCTAYCYLKVNQQVEDVEKIITQILVVDPKNIEALFLRYLSAISSKSPLMTSQIFDKLSKVLSQNNILIVQEAQSHHPVSNNLLPRVKSLQITYELSSEDESSESKEDETDDDQHYQQLLKQKYSKIKGIQKSGMVQCASYSQIPTFYHNSNEGFKQQDINPDSIAVAKEPEDQEDLNRDQLKSRKQRKVPEKKPPNKKVKEEIKEEKQKPIEEEGKVERQSQQQHQQSNQNNSTLYNLARDIILGLKKRGILPPKSMLILLMAVAVLLVIKYFVKFLRQRSIIQGSF